MKKEIIGCEEWLSLPDLNLPLIKARIDSGAKTSALHAFNIQTFRKNKDLWVSFDLYPLQDNRSTVLRCEAEVIDRREVKSSNGTIEKRYFIKSKAKLNQQEWDIELSLSNRDTMGFRMLLGREAMKGRFLVDPEQFDLCGKADSNELSNLYLLPKRSGGLRIAVLASNPELYSNKRLIEAGKERGHQMMFLKIKQCYMKLDAENPEIHFRGGKVLSQLDAVIPRIKPSVTFYGAALTRHFESLNIFTLNSAQAITQSRDKLFSLQLLQKSGLEIPITGFANSPIETQDLISMVGGAPLIIKLLEGTQGTGVVLAETYKAAESVINALKSLKINLLVQEFIKESDGKDLRCFVINGKVVACMQRTARAGEFRANVHKGADISMIKISSEEKKMAIQAAKTMGLQVAGVDLIRSNKGPLLLEVNSSPGLEGIEEATRKDIAREMIIAIEKSLKWQLDE